MVKKAAPVVDYSLNQSTIGSVSVVLDPANASSGPYTLTDTAANIQANLNSLQALSNIKAITVSDGGTISFTASQVTSDAGILLKIGSVPGVAVTGSASEIYANLTAINTSIKFIQSLSVTTGTVTLSAAEVTADAAVVAKLSIVAVSDTAASIASNINALNSNISHIASITSSDGGTVTLTAAQFTADSLVVAKLGAVNISDSAANIASNIDKLHNSIGNIGGITATNSGTVTLTASQVTKDADVVAKLSNVAVKDTAANIATNIDNLQSSNASIASITITDSNKVSLTASQFITDAAVVAKLGTVNISDTAASIVTNIVSLNGNISKIANITASDGVQVSLTASQFTTGSALVTKLGTVNISDTADLISGSIDKLQNNISSINTITATSGTVTLTAAQVANDSDVVARLSTVNITDTATGITSNLDALNSNISYIGSINTSTGTVTLTAAQVTADSAVVAKLSNVAVSDTAASIASNINALNSNISHIASIAASSGTVTLTAAQLTADAAVVAKLGIVNISDTAANIVTNINALNSSNYIGSIAASSGAISLTAAQVTADANAVAKMSGVVVTGTAASIASNITALNNNIDHIASITPANSGTVTLTAAQFTADSAVVNKLGTVNISDTAANIAARIDDLNGNIGKIANIGASDGLQVSLTAAQVTNDSAVVAKLSNVVVGDTADGISSNLTALNNNISHIASIAVSSGTVTLTADQLKADAAVVAKLGSVVNITDTATGITSNLDALNSNISYIGSINTSTGTVTLTAAQVTADSAVVAKLSNVAVSDTAASIASNINALNSNISHIASIAASSGTVTLTAAQLTADAAVVAKLGIVNISDTAANIVTNINALNSSNYIGSIAASSGAISLTAAQVTADANAVAKMSGVVVTGTAASIASNITALNNNIDHIASITPANSGTVTLTAAQFTADSAVVNKLGTVNISDTAANIAARIDDLNGNIGKIANIGASDGLQVSLTAAQFTADTAVVNKLGTVNISDSASVLNNNLNDLLNNAKVSGISSTDGRLSLSASQFSADTSVLSKLANGSLAVTDVSAGIVNTVTASAKVASLSVLD
ncbi:S-layer family protein, partial [Polynucleobacter sp. JS-Safj-400b-B2]|uniref:beta strand repeat-containing protein n=1 Tax=Polynucleobacter sp. JS-Safj-400b-B2 TaxID=2576921 RepID=UPI001C0B01C4